MKHLKAIDDKPVVPCPFCGVDGHIFQRGEHMLLEMPHPKKCPCHMLHHATYTIVTDDEMDLWNTRATIEKVSQD